MTSIETLAAEIAMLDGHPAPQAQAVTGAGATDTAALFVEHYFRRPGLFLLPEDLQPAVFDMYVTVGPNAVRILQRLLAKRGWSCRDDGRIGRQTLIAVKSAVSFMGTAALSDAYGEARREYCYALARSHPSRRKEVSAPDGRKGKWITRAESFVPRELWLSEADHQRRVETWT